MRRFPWFTKRRRIISLIAIVVVSLPPVVILYLNHRMRTLVDEIHSGGAGVQPQWGPAWLTGPLMRVGVRIDQPMMLWKVPAITVHRNRSISRSGVEQVVRAANRLGGVREVKVYEADVGAAALDSFRDLTDLRRLELQACPNDALCAVCNIPQLEELQLNKCPDVDLAGYSCLPALPRLKTLTIREVPIRSDELAIVAQIPNLQTLILDESTVYVKGLKQLTAAPRLERLSLFETLPAVYDQTSTFERDVIPIFQAMPALRELRIGGHLPPPDDEVAKLKEAIPSVTIIELDPFAPGGPEQIGTW